MEVEIADVHVLEETLRKVNLLSTQIITCLDSVSRNAQHSERAIRPIAGRNRKLAIYTNNLASGLEVINGIEGYAKLTAECNTIIQQRPDQVGIRPYLDATRSVITASQELNDSNLRQFHKVAHHAQQLVETSTASLRSYLESLLSLIYVPVDPKSISSPQSVLPSINPEAQPSLKLLFDHFNSIGKPYIFESCWVDAASKRISSSLPRAESRAGTEAGKQASSSHRDSLVALEKGPESLLSYTTCLQNLIVASAEDLGMLFGDKERDITLGWLYRLVDICLTDFVSIIRAVNNRVRTNVAEGSRKIFDAVHCVVSLTSTIEITLGRRISKLTDLMNTCKDTARLVFADFLRYIDSRVQNLTSLPSDNGVTAATVEVLSRLRKLAERRQTMAAAIEGMSQADWIPSPRPAWASILGSSSSNISAAANTATENDALVALATYFSDCMDCIILGHEVKARELGRKPASMGLLLLTNLTLIEETIRQSEMMAIFGPTGSERLAKLKKHSISLFLSGWNQAATLLMDTTTGKKVLSSKDRDAIKEKFKGFNAEFEELVRQHRQYSISDPTLRQEIAKEISTLISPLYRRFYNRHRGGDFSKNVDKYIKWDADQFDDVLSSL